MIRLSKKSKNAKKKHGELLTDLLSERETIQSFIDMICPSTISFFTDYYIVGNTYRRIWAVREYPTSTEEQAILRSLGEKDNVTLKIYIKHLTATEEKKVIENATNKNKMYTATTGDHRTQVQAASNLLDVDTIINHMHKNKEPLLFCAVYIEIMALSMEQLKELEDELLSELARGKINIDRLLMRQKEGFLSVLPVGYNAFKEQFFRALPASSVANLYPFSYSGKTDNKGFYIGRDKGGTNIIIDLNKRTEDKTNSNILILGNSGLGKSYLMKLLLTNIRESGKRICGLDPECEYEDLTRNLGGYYIDLMGSKSKYLINILEPKLFDDGTGEDEEEEYNQLTASFKGKSQLRQHISFLKDFFRAYKPELKSEHIDTLEIMLTQLYKEYRIDDYTDFSHTRSADYPILENLFALIEYERDNYAKGGKKLYEESTLQQLSLSLSSICIGNDSQFFNGYTNIDNDKFVMFGVKNIVNADENLKNAMLFNILSYMYNALLTAGNTVASIDEMYLFLSNIKTIEYIRNFMKRVRKKDSAIIIASQNVEDYLRPGIAELTKPLFSIPTYQFLFNPGSIDLKEFSKLLQLEQSEVQLIKSPHKGVCGNERYHLEVTAPEYKAILFGQAGGR